MTSIGKKLLFSLFLSMMFGLTTMTAAGADEKKEISIDAALSGGVRLLDLEGETYGLKAVPFFGFSIIPRVELIKRIFFSLELSLSYTLRSDYSGYYYYDSFGTIGLIPELGLIFPGESVDFAIFTGGGIFASFSEYDTGSQPAVAARAGIELKEGFVRGIYISYSHVFSETFQSYESIKLFATTPLLYRSNGRRDIQ
jgi:hypothetical protein